MTPDIADPRYDFDHMTVNIGDPAEPMGERLPRTER